MPTFGGVTADDPAFRKVRALVPQCPRCGSATYTSAPSAPDGSRGPASVACANCGEDILAAYNLLGTGGRDCIPLLFAFGLVGAVTLGGLWVVVSMGNHP